MRWYSLCGIIGVFSRGAKYQVAPYIHTGLIGLQHRGQESCGMAVFDGAKIQLHKGMGTVSEAMKEDTINSMFGFHGIGHVRYSTTGVSELRNAHPILVSYSDGQMAIAHNGNIANAAELRKELEERGHVFMTTTDTEVIGHLLAIEYVKTRDMVESLKRIATRLDGAYSLVVLTANALYAARDPYGIRPLCLGELDSMVMVSSESCGLDTIGAKTVRDLSPGEILEISETGSVSASTGTGKRAHCMFEYVYFSRPDSILDGKEVYSVRKSLGNRLAESNKIDADKVIAVPSSGISAALGFSEKSGLPYGEGLMKNRFIGRTFIMPTQKQRENGVRMKLNPIVSEINGKRVIVIDDSIVRGTTSKKLVNMLRSIGAKEVHLVSSCPPVKFPCFYGVDMASKDELIAANNSVEEIGKLVGADSVVYQNLDDLVSAIGIDKCSLCTGCLDGNYPTEKAKQRELSSWVKQ